MLLSCHAVVLRSHAIELALPWPHHVGALPTDELRPDFAPPDDPTHPFRRGEFHRAIRLDGDLDDLDVGTVVAAICLYMNVVYPEDADDDDDAPMPPAADILARLRDAESVIVAGGVEVVADGEVLLSPGCCAGLETWPEWPAFAAGGPPPWAGHDPDPVLERLPSGLLAVGRERGVVRHLEPADLRAALVDAARDLAGFADRLAAWARALVPDLAPALVDRLTRDLHLRG